MLCTSMKLRVLSECYGFLVVVKEITALARPPLELSCSRKFRIVLVSCLSFRVYEAFSGRNGTVSKGARGIELFTAAGIRCRRP